MILRELMCGCCFPEPVHISGEQRLKMAQERVQGNQSSLQKDLNARRAGSSVHVKQEPLSDQEDEPMDTSSSSSSIPNGSVNGYPSATSPALDHTNGNGGSPANTASQELQDFVIKTFRKHFVLTLNEFKRLFNLHLASMPVGRSVFPSISDHMLQDAILLCQCKQIMVPVSIHTGFLLSKLRINKELDVKPQFIFTGCPHYSYFSKSLSLLCHLGA